MKQKTKLKKVKPKSKLEQWRTRALVAEAGMRLARLTMAVQEKELSKLRDLSDLIESIWGKK